MRRIETVWQDCRAATAIEYTLIAAGIAFAIAIVVFAFGDQLALLIGELTSILDAG